MRERLHLDLPAGAPIASPFTWRPGLCLVCRRSTTPDGRVVFIDHEHQDALVTGLCRLDGCLSLAQALVTTWTSGSPHREVTLRPAT